MINLSIGKGRYITCCQIQNCIVRAWTPAETGYCHAHTYCIWLNVVIFSLLLIYRQMDELKLTHCTLWKKKSWYLIYNNVCSWFNSMHIYNNYFDCCIFSHLQLILLQLITRCSNHFKIHWYLYTVINFSMPYWPLWIRIDIICNMEYQIPNITGITTLLTYSWYTQ